MKRRRATDVMSPRANPLTAFPARFRPDCFTLLTIAIAALGIALVLGHVTFGVVLGVDSAYYIHAARSLLAGEGLLRFDGLPYSLWPPLYPLLLAAASLGIFDPLDVAGPLNAVIFGLTVFVVGWYLRQRLESRFLAAWGCLATALAVPLTFLSSWVFSDTLFILLVTLALVWTDRFLADGRLRTLVWVAIFSTLAWQTRYIGVAVPAFVGLVLLFQPKVSMTRRAGQVAIYSLIVAVPMALWLLRNFLVIGKFTTHLPPWDYPVPMMLQDIFEILWRWAHTNTAVVLAPFVCILIIVQWRRLKVADWRPFWLFGGFVPTHIVLFILSISLLVGIYPERGIGVKQLVPIYIPLLIVGVFALDRVLHHERERRLLGSVGSLPVIRRVMPGKKGSVLAAIVMIVLSLGVVSQAVLNVRTVTEASRGDLDRGFNGPRWTGSETLRYVRENLVGTKIYSNLPRLLSLHIGRIWKYAFYHRLPTSHTRLKRVWSQDGDYVVWFYRAFNQNRYDYGEADLRLLPNLEPVAELEDGIVFKVTR